MPPQRYLCPSCGAVVAASCPSQASVLRCENCRTSFPRQLAAPAPEATEDSQVTAKLSSACLPQPAEKNGRRNSSSITSLLPENFGPYHIAGEISRGGMGAVFCARDLRNGRLVALKVLLSGEEASGQEVARFRREAEACSRLNHPGIVEIFEVGEIDGRVYIAMELVEGESLAVLLKRRKLPAEESLRLMRQVCEAVAHAHDEGIVHRDLKPANILVDRYDTCRITDFGLAKDSAHLTALTHSGAVLGTPRYMAPEQIQGQTHLVGPRSDVWALGAVLYQLLTGQPPFSAEDPLRLALRIAEEDPLPPRQVNPRVPREVQTIILKCLEKEPQRRYGSARALGEDLERFLTGEPIRARPSGSAHRLARKIWRHREALAGVSALAAIGAVVVLLAAKALASSVGAVSSPASGSVAAARRKAATRLEAGDLAGAEGFLQQALAENPRDAGAGIDLALTILKGELKKRQENGPDTVFDRARLRQAFAHLERAARLQPSRAAEAHQIAAWFFRRTGAPLEEVPHLQRAVARQPHCPKTRFQYASALRAAYLHTREPRWLQEALAQLGQILCRDPEDSRAQKMFRELATLQQRTTSTTKPLTAASQ